LIGSQCHNIYIIILSTTVKDSAMKRLEMAMAMVKGKATSRLELSSRQCRKRVPSDSLEENLRE
jgi:hypothetical protein